MKEHGVIKWPKKVEEIYWKGFRHVRSPIYFAYMQTAGEKIQAILDELGVSDIDTGDYNALPGWKRCATLDAKDEEYDMQAIYHRVAHQQFSYTFQNPWLNEINAQDPYTNYISINAVTARRKGIADGDDIWVRAKGAGSTLGVAKLVEGIHPEVVAIPNNGGHWAKGMPVAKDKGTFFEPLMTTDWAHTDPIVIALDADAAVKIEKARPEDKNRSMRWGKKGER
jgi:molybdopterin-containing oxidoreductase family molybdopterin binding subunit